MEQKPNMEIKPRRPKTIFDRRSVFFSCVITIMFGYLIFTLNTIEKQAKQAKSVSPESTVYRELGNKLKSEKLFDQAVAAYKLYLEDPGLSGETRADVHYLMGNLYFEQNKYEEALSAFYAADLLGASAAVKSDLNIKIINCLERLGRDFSAEYALKSRTSLDKKEKTGPSEGLVVATYSGGVITMRDIDEQLEKLPEDQRKEFRDPQKKFMFLQQYIARILLARKARKMGYDRDAEIASRLEDIKDQLMIEKMVQSEFKQKVSPSPEDIKLYYDAHKANYNEPESAQIAHILTDTYEKAQAVQKKLKEGADFAQLSQSESLDKTTSSSGGVLPDWLSTKNATSGGVDRTEIVKAALEPKENDAFPIVQDSQGVHVIKVLGKKPARERGFEEVYQDVARDYQLFKADKLYRTMMEEILKVEGVTINQEAFFPKGESEDKKVDIQKLDTK